MHEDADRSAADGAEIKRDELDKLTERIIAVAMKIRKKLGSSFVEKIYEKTMAYEFKKNKIRFVEEGGIKVKYETIELGDIKG